MSGSQKNSITTKKNCIKHEAKQNDDVYVGDLRIDFTAALASRTSDNATDEKRSLTPTDWLTAGQVGGQER